MKQFKRIGVFLKGSAPDQAVLAFAHHMSQLGAEQFHFVHVIDTDEEPPLADEAEYEAKVRAALPADMTDSIKWDTRRGNHLEHMLRVARDDELNLMIVGRKLPCSQAGLRTRIPRIVRKSPCSVLVVPELCQPHFGRILVALDCSVHSKEAMEAAVALAIASREAKPQLLALTVRQVATRYNLAGVTFDEFAASQREHGERELRSFVSSIDTQGTPVEPLVVLSEEPGLAISHVATAKKMDIVVAGSRGVTSTAAALLGSTSEELLMACAAPTLIVKKRGETLHLLEALFST